MTFLQPLVLFGLPLVLTPVIIHLLNRLRHRPKPWAAMRFLVSATRSTTARSKLRQFLILACRVLAVAALIFFLARPLAGGWLGWALSSAPDAILILLDRSASMETQNNGTSRRQEAIQMLAQAATQFEETSHLILIDSVTRAPQEISRATNLAQLPITGPSDTAADIPAMLRAAFDWLVENRAGSAEIWIASDNQRSNWLPDDCSTAWAAGMRCRRHSSHIRRSQHSERLGTPRVAPCLLAARRMRNRQAAADHQRRTVRRHTTRSRSS